MRLAIVGSRTLKLIPYEIEREVVKHYDLAEISLIVSGGALGVDSTAEEWAKRHVYKPILIIPPDYNRYPGWQAPKERNTQIVQFVDAAIAFQQGKSGGTRDVIDKCRQLNKPCVVVSYK